MQVFVDADKASYEAYYRRIIDDKLLSPNGALVLDNTLYKGAMWAPNPMYDDAAKDVEAANKAIYDDDRVETVVLPIRDGVTIVRWKDGSHPPSG